MKQNESGGAVAELCREHRKSAAQLYGCCAKYGGMDASMMKRLKEWDAENRRLDNRYGEAHLKTDYRPPFFHEYPRRDRC